MRIYITQIKPDVVISSDLKRARFTAYEIVDPSVVEVESRLRERNFGSLTGRSWSEVQQFAESNFQTGQDCNGWRSVGGECTHELASRTQDFLLDLCSRLIEKPVNHADAQGQVPFPIIGSRDAPPMEEIISKYFSEFLKKNNADRHSSSSIYAGHVLLVSHGGWIRQFLRLLACNSQHKQNFPKQCVSSVMNNCAVCQVGVAFDRDNLKSYQKCPQNNREISVSPLPIFGSNVSHNGTSNIAPCSYVHAANPCLPIMAVCYQFNVTNSMLGNLSSIHDASSISTSSTKVLCTQQENVSQDEDEYAGHPSA
ncbi:unnamed protein product, partial [Heterobilharzia americana]